MISANTDALEKSLVEYKLEVERKLKHMVAMFAMDIAHAASDETKRGDEVRLRNLYTARFMQRGIAPKAGFHKGAWEYTEGELTFTPTIYDVGHMLERVDFQAVATYKIGDTFSIGAKGTAYSFLERRDGILEDAEHTIKAAYSSNLKQYFDQG
jgi:hypothetical protein